jgi:twitching motility protein PilI
MTAAPRPFDLLLDLAARARSGNEGTEARIKIQPHWSGVGFSLLGRRMVAPMTQIAEILILPSLTRLPRVQAWVQGVLNVRGRLLPVIDLAAFLGGKAGSNRRAQRALVIEIGDMFCGLTVDEVHGLKHFAIDAYRHEVDALPETVRPFVEGSYVTPDENWTLLRPDRIVVDPRFLDAARK